MSPHNPYHTFESNLLQPTYFVLLNRPIIMSLDLIHPPTTNNTLTRR